MAGVLYMHRHQGRMVHTLVFPHHPSLLIPLEQGHPSLPYCHAQVDRRSADDRLSHHLLVLARPGRHPGATRKKPKKPRLPINGRGEAVTPSQGCGDRGISRRGLTPRPLDPPTLSIPVPGPPVARVAGRGLAARRAVPSRICCITLVPESVMSTPYPPRRLCPPTPCAHPDSLIRPVRTNRERESERAR